MSVVAAGRQPGSLPIAVARHVLGLLAAAVLLFTAGTVAGIETQPVLWIAAAAAAGAIAGLIDRGWLGLLFVELGLAAGIGVQLIVNHHAPDEAAAAFAAAAWLYLAVLAAGAAAYLIVRLVRRQLS